MDPVSIRVATLEDAGSVADVFIASRADSMPYLPNVHTDDDVRDWIARTVLPDTEVTVAEISERIVGFMSLHLAFLEHLYVHPGFVGLGIGSLLLARAKDLRPHGFELWVFQKNVRARRFYEARGLTLVELTSGEGNEEKEPDALYGWLPDEDMGVR